MKVIKTAGGNQISMSKKEWQSIGKTAGWNEDGTPDLANEAFDSIYNQMTRKINTVPERVKFLEDLIASLDQQKNFLVTTQEQEAATQDEEVDLFDKWERLPENIIGILDRFNERFDAGDEGYMLCKELIEELEQNGYTAEYGLDAVPFGLKKL